MGNPIKMDDLGVPLFSETSMYGTANSDDDDDDDDDDEAREPLRV